MGFEEGIRVLATSLFVAVILEVAVMIMGDAVIGQLALRCAAPANATFGGNDLAVLGILIAHLMPVVVAGTGFIYAFVKMFEPGRIDGRRRRRRRF